jgi:DNA-binding transcriptional LysR family regulator
MALGYITAAEDELRAVAGVESGSVRLGAFLSASNSFVPDAVARFEAAHPDIRIRLEQIEEPADLRRVRSGDLDLAVVFRVRDGQTELSPPDESFDEAHLADDRYHVVLPPAHPLARRRQLTIAELADERFTAPPAGGFQPYRELLDRLCADAGFEPNVAHEVNDVTVARAFVAAGLGIAVLPDLALAPPREDVAVRPIRGIQPFRSIYATWLRDRRAPAVSKMVRYLANAATARLG